MILDRGYCSIYRTENTAEPGDEPVEIPVLKYQSWYGELNFESSPRDIGAQEGVVIANKIRVLQNRDITNHDIAVLSSVLPIGDTPAPGAPQYNVVRAYHGTDDENGQPISDLSLERLVQE